MHGKITQRCSHRTPGGSSVVGCFCLRLRDCAQYPQSLGAAFAASQGRHAQHASLDLARARQEDGLSVRVARRPLLGRDHILARAQLALLGRPGVPVGREGRRLRHPALGLLLGPALGRVLAEAWQDDAAAAAL
eukprot:1897460-Prymnesium_polylepis.1